jgi:rubrerythrin
MLARLRLDELKDFSILVGWICVYLAGAWWLTEWRCPRCGKIFANRLWTQRCISCGLSKEDVATVMRRK